MKLGIAALALFALAIVGALYGPPGRPCAGTLDPVIRRGC